MKTFNKVAKKIIDIGFTILIIFALVVLVANYVGFNLYVVRSGSMEPNIHTGSIAIVYERADFYEIEVGDVVAFKLVNGELVTHRVEEITKIDGITHFLTKGDANEVSDGYTTNIQNFYGETIFSIPGVGYIADWASSTQGIIVLIGAVLILIVVYNMLDNEEEVEVQEEWEEIVEYIEVDEFGNEIIASATPVDEPVVDPPILVIEEDGVEIECTGEEEKHEDDPPSDNLDAECTAFIEDETAANEELVEDNETTEKVVEEPVKEEEQEEVIEPAFDE